MLDVDRLADIGLNPDDARLGRLANSCNRFFKWLRSARNYGDIGARGREPGRHRKADPFATASDNSSPPQKTDFHCVLPNSSIRSSSFESEQTGIFWSQLGPRKQILPSAVVMSALGQRRTFSNVRRMSALHPKADILIVTSL